MTKLREDLKAAAECGLPAALEVMGERWSFLILRAAFNGLVHFEEFSGQLGIARNILSNRLARLVEHGVLARIPSQEDRRKVEYRMTEKGSDLLPAMLALRQRGARLAGTTSPGSIAIPARPADAQEPEAAFRRSPAVSAAVWRRVPGRG